MATALVAEEELDGFVADYAARIGANAPLTLASMKFIVGEVLKDPDTRDLAACDDMVTAYFFPARITSRGAPPSWKSASRSSRDASAGIGRSPRPYRIAGHGGGRTLGLAEETAKHPPSGLVQSDDRRPDIVACPGLLLSGIIDQQQGIVRQPHQRELSSTKARGGPPPSNRSSRLTLPLI